jgi:hypothetical protein
MSRLDTKAARLEAQSARIQYLIGQGYTREDYKQLIILTNNWKREDFILLYSKERQQWKWSTNIAPQQSTEIE